MIRPTLDLAVAFNRVSREADEWFDEPDDLERVQRAVGSIADLVDVVEAAAALAYRVTRAQGFGEGNKRTALALAKGFSTATARTARCSSQPMIASSPTSSSRQRLAATSSANSSTCFVAVRHRRGRR